MAARLCAEAEPWQILVTQRVHVRDRATSRSASRSASWSCAGSASRSARTTSEVLTPPGSRHDQSIADERPRQSAVRPRLSQLDEAARYERFDVLQARMARVWDAMRLNSDGESVVIVPSVSLDRAVERTGSLTQAYEERYLFLLLLLRQPRLRMIYVTSMPVAPTIVEYYLALLSGVIPSHARGRLSMISVGDSSPQSLSEKLLARPKLLARSPALIPDKSLSHLHPLQHHRARARRRAGAGHPDVRRRPAAGGPGEQDRVPAACSRTAGVRHPLGAEDLHSVDEVVAAVVDMRRERPSDDAGHRQAERRGVGRGERRRRSVAGSLRRGHRTSGTQSAARVMAMQLEAPDLPDSGLPRRVCPGGRHRGGAHPRGRGTQPERAAAGDAARRRRAVVHARSASRWCERPELPGLPLPGRLRLRTADRRAGQDHRGAAGEEGALGRFAVDFVVTRAARRELDAVRDRAQPAQGRHHAPVSHPAVPHRRRATTPTRVCS